MFRKGLSITSFAAAFCLLLGLVGCSDNPVAPMKTSVKSGQNDFTENLPSAEIEIYGRVGVTGNLDGLGSVDLSDLSLMIAHITMANVEVRCPGEWNLNGQGAIDLTDLSIMIAYVTGVLPQLPTCP